MARTNKGVEFWRNKAALMFRAWKIKANRDMERQEDGEKYLSCLFSLCLIMAWSEFKENSLWVPIEEAIEKSGKRMRIVYYWVQTGALSGQKVKNKWWVNLSSLEEYLERRADKLVKDGYLTLKEAAEKAKKHYLAIWKLVKSGKIEADMIDGKVLIHEGVLRCIFKQCS